MSTAGKPDLDNAIEQAKKEVREYVETVHAVCAFVSLILPHQSTHPDTPAYSLGRIMHTSDNNRVTREVREVTPDVVVQQSLNLGYVGEAKASLPQYSGYWHKRAEQLYKYDDDLTGWWTPDAQMPVSDLVSLIAAPHTTRFAEFVQQHAQQTNWTWARKLCFIEISYTKEGECIYLKLQRGQLTDQRVYLAFQQGCEFAREDLIADFNGARFCDATPPCELLMQILWQDVFNRKRITQHIERDETLKCWPLHVTAAGITEELQRESGSARADDRDVHYPQEGWISGALDAFVSLNLAERENGDAYLIKLRQLRGELIEKFAEHRLNLKPKAKPEYQAVQPTLFDD